MTGRRRLDGPGRSRGSEQAGAGADVVVEADCVVEISGPGGDTSGLLQGSGQQVRLQVDRPEAVIATMGGQARARLIELLGTAGLRAELLGPQGRVASYDPRRDSRIGSLLWGSGHVVVDRAGWGVLTRAVLPQGLPPQRALFIGAAVLAAAGVSRWLRHRDTAGRR